MGTCYENRSALFSVASLQRGYFTQKQAVESGYARSSHSRQVSSGVWQRVRRGIYRLSEYPEQDNEDLVILSLWSRGQDGVSQGVFSHDTALSYYGMSDVLSYEWNMTVPMDFRRSAEIPSGLNLYRARLADSDISSMDGFTMTTPVRTFVDIMMDGCHDKAIIDQCFVDMIQKNIASAADFAKTALSKKELFSLSEYLGDFISSNIFVAMRAEDKVYFQRVCDSIATIVSERRELCKSADADNRTAHSLLR